MSMRQHWRCGFWLTSPSCCWLAEVAGLPLPGRRGGCSCCSVSMYFCAEKSCMIALYQIVKSHPALVLVARPWIGSPGRSFACFRDSFARWPAFCLCSIGTRYWHLSSNHHLQDLKTQWNAWHRLVPEEISQELIGIADTSHGQEEGQLQLCHTEQSWRVT